MLQIRTVTSVLNVSTNIITITLPV